MGAGSEPGDEATEDGEREQFVTATLAKAHKFPK